jgi:hypothetical protein
MMEESEGQSDHELMVERVKHDKSEEDLVFGLIDTAGQSDDGSNIEETPDNSNTIIKDSSQDVDDMELGLSQEPLLVSIKQTSISDDQDSSNTIIIDSTSQHDDKMGLEFSKQESKRDDSLRKSYRVNEASDSDLSLNSKEMDIKLIEPTKQSVKYTDSPVIKESSNQELPSEDLGLPDSEEMDLGLVESTEHGVKHTDLPPWSLESIDHSSQDTRQSGESSKEATLQKSKSSNHDFKDDALKTDDQEESASVQDEIQYFDIHNHDLEGEKKTEKKDSTSEEANGEDRGKGDGQEGEQTGELVFEEESDG